MTPSLFAVLISLGIPLMGVIVWSIRQEGRINAHDTLFVERKERAEEITDDIKARLVRIEAKLDRANGHSATQ